MARARLPTAPSGRETREGRPRGLPSRSIQSSAAGVYLTVVGIPFTLPVRICFSSTFSAATIAAGTFAEILPSPTPPARTEKIVLP